MRHAHNTALVRLPVRIYMIGMRHTILADTHCADALKVITFGSSIDDFPQGGRFESTWGKVKGFISAQSFKRSICTVSFSLQYIIMSVGIHVHPRDKRMLQRCACD